MRNSGITDSARNDNTPKGQGTEQPSAAAAAFDLFQLMAHRFGCLQRQQARQRQRQPRQHLALGGDDESPAALGERTRMPACRGDSCRQRMTLCES